MTLKEMQVCAAETLDYFIQVMSDVPFSAEDIVIEFAPKSKLVERAQALCALYVPDKVLNESQKADLKNNVRGNALIGKKKSAIIIRMDSRISADELRTVIFHELAHIYCAKLEMKGQMHFVDIYGSGTTFDNDNAIADGFLCSGYEVWSEFIAHYYALKWTQKQKSTMAQESAYINHLISEVDAAHQLQAKRNLAMACAYFISCSDAESEITLFKEEFDEDMPQIQRSFLICLFHLYDHLQKDKPWEITEDFISDLGGKYTMLLTLNSFGGLIGAMSDGEETW